MPFITKGFHRSRQFMHMTLLHPQAKSEGGKTTLSSRVSRWGGFTSVEQLGHDNSLVHAELRNQLSSTSHAQITVSKHSPGEKGFSSVWLYFLCGRKNVTTSQCIFLVLQRQKDLPAFICSIPLHQRKISDKPDREDKVYVWRQDVSRFPRTVVLANFIVYVFSPSFSSFPSLFSPSVSPCDEATSRPKHIFNSYQIAKYVISYPILFKFLAHYSLQ